LHPAPGIEKQLTDKGEHQQQTGDHHFRVALFAFFSFFHIVGLDGCDRFDR
jgi:hypothetical protein